MMRYPFGSRKFLLVLTIALGIGAGASAWAMTPTPTPSASGGRPIPVRATTLVSVTGAYHVDFPKGPSAVVIAYGTNIAITDLAALSAQADELMKFFRSDVEADGVSVAVFRASRDGQGYGFVYERQANGAWKRKTP